MVGLVRLPQSTAEPLARIFTSLATHLSTTK